MKFESIFRTKMWIHFNLRHNYFKNDRSPREFLMINLRSKLQRVCSESKNVDLKSCSVNSGQTELEITLWMLCMPSQQMTIGKSFITLTADCHWRRRQARTGGLGFEPGHELVDVGLCDAVGKNLQSNGVKWSSVMVPPPLRDRNIKLFAELASVPHFTLV